MSVLEQAFPPLYLHHRFQLNGALNSLGGAEYYYALRGDGQTPVTIVPGDEQRRALDAALKTLEPEFLAVPERILSMIPPPAYRYEEGEIFPRATGLLFDPLTAADVAADFTASLIFHPERMARLVEYGSRSEEYPGLDDVLDRVLERTWYAPRRGTGYVAQVQEVAQRSVLDILLEQGSNADNPARVRAVLTAKLDGLADRIETETSAPRTDCSRSRTSADGRTAPKERYRVRRRPRFPREIRSERGSHEPGRRRRSRRDNDSFLRHVEPVDGARFYR
jgi:hypothetical protein